MIAKTAFAAGVVAAAVALFGCGGGNDTTGGGAYGGGSTSNTQTSAGTGYGSSQKTSGAATGGGAALVDVAQNPKLGPILVDSKGFTLYDFHKDQGTKSLCNGACASVWPPLMTSGAPQPQKGAKASLLGTTKRSDGSTQVTYAGHPLYFYAHEGPGQVLCHDVVEFGGRWLVVTPEGTAAP